MNQEIGLLRLLSLLIIPRMNQQRMAYLIKSWSIPYPIWDGWEPNMMYLECESVGEHTCTSYYSFFSTLSSSFYSALSSSFTTTPDIITIDSCWLSLVESLIFNKGVTSFFKNQRIDKWYLSSLPFFKDIIDYPCVIVGCWEDHHPSIQRAPLRGAIETTGSERSFFCAGVAGPFLLDMSPSRSQKDLDRTGRTRKSAWNVSDRVSISEGKMMTESHLRDSQGPHVVDVRFHIMSPHIA